MRQRRAKRPRNANDLFRHLFVKHHDKGIWCAVRSNTSGVTMISFDLLSTLYCARASDCLLAHAAKHASNASESMSPKTRRNVSSEGIPQG